MVIVALVDDVGRNDDIALRRVPIGIDKARDGLGSLGIKLRNLAILDVGRTVGILRTKMENHLVGIAVGEAVAVDAVIVGELVLEELKNLDEVAYVRFASVYREFEDVLDFVRQLTRAKKLSIRI